MRYLFKLLKMLDSMIKFGKLLLCSYQYRQLGFRVTSEPTPMLLS